MRRSRRCWCWCASGSPASRVHSYRKNVKRSTRNGLTFHRERFARSSADSELRLIAAGDRVVAATAGQPGDRDTISLVPGAFFELLLDHHQTMIVGPGDQIVDREPAGPVDILVDRVEPEADLAIHPLPALQRVPLLVLVAQRHLHFIEQ